MTLEALIYLEQFAPFQSNHGLRSLLSFSNLIFVVFLCPLLSSKSYFVCSICLHFLVLLLSVFSYKKYYHQDSEEEES